MNMSTSSPPVEIQGLSRQFQNKLALDNVGLRIERGRVFGLVGENGAGKTTLIKHILGLLRAKSGSVRVFGLNPVDSPVEVLSRIGSLSENRDLPGWMRVAELLRYTAAFYRSWDSSFAEQLRQQFGLDPAARVKDLSRGENARAALLLALAFRPDLLVLDEPSSGLDPVVRRDILEAIIRTVADEGRTVIFSTHLLDEVERVSDHIAMLHQGRLKLCAPLEEIKARHRRLSLRFDAPRAEPPAVSGAIRVDGAGREWTVISDAQRCYAPAAAQHLGAVIVEDTEASLDDIFVAHSGH